MARNPTLIFCSSSCHYFRPLFLSSNLSEIDRACGVFYFYFYNYKKNSIFLFYYIYSLKFKNFWQNVFLQESSQFCGNFIMQKNHVSRLQQSAHRCFFSSIFCCSQIGNDPQEYLTKFGSKLNMKGLFFKNILL